MKNLLVICLILVIFVELDSACHAVNHRRKRQTYEFHTAQSPAENTNILRQYFSNCMKSQVGDIWDWPSVIDATILDTSWYERNDELTCSSSKFGDTPACWIVRLTALLKRDSFLLRPARQCIERYNIDTKRGVVRESARIFAKSRKSGGALVSYSRRQSQISFLKQPAVQSYVSCASSRTRFSLDRNQLDFPSVVQFVEGHTICSSELPGCDVNDQVRATLGDPDVPRWPYRFAAIIRNTSPLVNTLSSCNEMVFPLNAGWSSWSACSASCGGGSRSRTRQCFQPGCNGFETQGCGEMLCPGCAMSRYSRRRCGSVRISKESCLQMGCCYQGGFCYRSLRTRRPPTGSNPCRPLNNFRTLSLSFRPTAGTLRNFGGEPGYPGSSARFQCDNSQNNRRCGGRGMTCYSCSRAGCCWNAARRACFHANIQIVRIRTECPPGFENPPACTDINDCTPTSCMNGGKCVDRIQGFECRCPPPFTGSRCEVDPTTPQGCSLPILTTPDGNGRITTSLRMFPVGSSLTYQCDPGLTPSGPVVTVCQELLPNVFTWSLDTSLPSCVRECRLEDAPTPASGVTIILPRPVDSFMVAESLTYMCLNRSEFIDPNTVTCQSNGMWLPAMVGICTEKTCSLSTAPVVANTTRTPSTNGPLVPGTFVVYQCNNGLETIAPNTAVCQQDGSWMPDAGGLGRCRQTRCGLPILTTPNGNGRITTLETSFPVRTRLTYVCDLGFSASGQTVTECRLSPPDTFFWSLDTSRPLCLPDDDCLTGASNCTDNAFCMNTGTGFTCICAAGFSGDGFTSCEDLDECDFETDNCDSNAVCSNTIGSFACTCDGGFSGNGVSCEDIDECSLSTDNCDTNAMCMNTLGSFVCTCNVGFSGNGIMCNDVDECALGTDDCSSTSVCTNTVGSFTCGCSPGFTGDGIECTDIDECSLSTDNCDTNAMCMNTPGSFVCTCNVGFSGNGIMCNDVDECALGTDDCSSTSVCTNTVGSFTCGCSPGFTGDGIECTARLITPQSGETVENCEPNCDTNAMCMNTPGSFVCTCNVGFSGDGIMCNDVDECALDTDDCSSTSVCMNTVGSFTCGCSSGFTGDGIECTDIDECTLDLDNCNDNAQCMNAVGSFVCNCNPGFSGDGMTCQDIDECDLGMENCENSAVCINSVGSFICRCEAGFTGDGVSCSDIDECALNLDNCEDNTQCMNTVGSFVCNCNPGFSGDGMTCNDIDECLLGTDNCDVNAFCTNTVGSFVCDCAPGFSGDGFTCTDIDECSLGSDNCDVNAQCINEMGTFSCECNAGFTGDGVTCIEFDICDLCDSTNADCVDNDGEFSCVCIEGFVGDGITCTASSITCAEPPPGNPNVGHFPELTTPYPVNIEVFYFCFTGTLSGPLSNICLETSMWRNGAPTCT